jgi:hypothetical protein
MAKGKDGKSLMEQYREGEQNAFLREVQEDVNRDRIVKIWHRFKYWIIAAVLLPVAAAFIVSARYERMMEISRNEAARYDEITEAPDDAERLKLLLEFAESAEYAYRDIAYQAAYTIQLGKNDPAGAIATLKLAIGNATDESFKNAAAIKLSLMPEYKDAADKIRLLESVRRRSPLYHSARLALALVYMRENSDAKAQSVLDELAQDDTLPPDAKDQVNAMREFVKTKKML